MLRPVHALRLAARGLCRVPGTALTAVLTLGIGLSATVAILGILDGAVRPLPVPGGGAIVQVRLLDAEARPAALPAVPLERWAVGSAVEAAGAVRPMQATLTHPAAPALRASGAALTATVLPLLGLPPALGRLPGGDPADADALVLGWDLWTAMGAEPGLLGTRVELDGRGHTIVGVMPEGFGFPENQSFWTVLPEAGAGDEVVARLAAGASPEAAAAALQGRLAGVPLEEGRRGPYRAQVLSWTRSRGEGGEAAMFAGLATLVGLLLVLCAANVATLLVVRATEGGGALAVHAALGASRAQVGFQLFAEALLIALAGGIVGLAGGFAVLRWMEVNLAPHWGYFWMSMEVRPPVLLWTFAVVIVTAVLAGTAPALRAMRTDLRDVLAGGGRGVSTRAGRRLERGFVGAQVALSTFGLVAAAFLGWGAAGMGRGLERLPLESVAIATVTPSPERYADPPSRAELREALRRELLRIPGARAASVSGAVPGFDGASASVAVAGRATAEEADARTFWLAADPHLPEAYGVRIVAGRGLTASDDASAPAVVLVTRSFARRFVSGSGVGARLRLAGVHQAGQWAEVVGILEDWYPDQPGRRADRVLVPLAQAEPARVYLSVRMDGDARLAVAGLRTAVARVDDELAVEQPSTLGALMDWLLRMKRVIGAFGVLGGLAGVLVAGIGLYGVMSFQVRARLPEIGVRMALGADAPRIVREVLRESLVRVAPGLGVGLLLGALASPALGGMYLAARGRAPLLLGAVAAGMLAVGLLAGLHPARRAARLDPQSVLRPE